MNGLAAGDLFGSSVAGVGDVDGDGLDDFFVGARQQVIGPGAGYATVFSGATGLPLPNLSLTGLAAGDQFGRAVAGAGDVNGDGVPDLIVGAPLADPGGLSSAGQVTVFSGATGAALPGLTLNGSTPGASFGHSVATRGIPTVMACRISSSGPPTSVSLATAWVK